MPFYNSALKPAAMRDTIIDRAFDAQLENMKDNKTARKFTADELAAVAQKAHEELSAMPEEYDFVFALPDAAKPVVPKRIGPTATIYTVTKAQETEYQQLTRGSSLQELLSGEKSLIPSFKHGQCLLKVRVKGVVTRYGHIQIDNYDPLFVYKVVMALFDVGIYFMPSNSRSPAYFTAPYSYQAFRCLSGTPVRSFQTDIKDAEFKSKRKFRPTSFDDGSFDERCKTIRKVMTNVAASQPRAVRELQRRVRNSCYWYYEAVTSRETHAKIMYVVSAIDSLVGSQIDTKENKAELIAQSICDTAENEAKVRTDIIALYSLRNDIVHGLREVNSMSTFMGDDSGDSEFDLLYRGIYALKVYLRKRLGSLVNS